MSDTRQLSPWTDESAVAAIRSLLMRMSLHESERDERGPLDAKGRVEGCEGCTCEYALEYIERRLREALGA